MELDLFIRLLKIARIRDQEGTVGTDESAPLRRPAPASGRNDSPRVMEDRTLLAAGQVLQVAPGPDPHQGTAADDWLMTVASITGFNLLVLMAVALTVFTVRTLYDTLTSGSYRTNEGRHGSPGLDPHQQPDGSSPDRVGVNFIPLDAEQDFFYFRGDYVWPKPDPEELPVIGSSPDETTALVYAGSNGIIPYPKRSFTADI